MSGEISYRRYAGAPALRPMYLSDKLTPWYGSWTNGDVVSLLIANDALPDSSTLRRIYGVSNNNPCRFVLNLTPPQNIMDDCVLEFWVRSSDVNASLRIWNIDFDWYTGFLTAGIGTTEWVKFKVPFSSWIRYSGVRPKSMAFSILPGFQFYFTNVVGSTLQMAGVNIRRL